MARSRACARITEDGRSPALPFTSTWALPWHSPLLAGNQWQSVAISGNQHALTAPRGQLLKIA